MPVRRAKKGEGPGCPLLMIRAAFLLLVLLTVVL